MKDVEQVGTEIISAAICVHSHLGPGLLESVYQRCLRYELETRGMKVLCEAPLPVRYREISIDVGYRIDMVVEDCVLVENKAVERLAPVHEAQLLTYLRQTGFQLGYLLNWNVVLLKQGIKRMVNRL